MEILPARPWKVLAGRMLILTSRYNSARMSCENISIAQSTGVKKPPVGGGGMERPQGDLGGFCETTTNFLFWPWDGRGIGPRQNRKRPLRLGRHMGCGDDGACLRPIRHAAQEIKTLRDGGGVKKAARRRPRRMEWRDLCGLATISMDGASAESANDHVSSHIAGSVEYRLLDCRIKFCRICHPGGSQGQIVDRFHSISPYLRTYGRSAAASSSFFS